MFHVKHSLTGRRRLDKRPPEQISAAQGERRKTHSRSRDPPCVSCETSEWGMRPHPPPPASVRNPHAPAPARRTQPGLPRQHVAARRPDAHPRLPASQSPLRTTCLPAPASARDPTGSRAAVCCPHAPPERRWAVREIARACPQSRREPARPAQGAARRLAPCGSSSPIRARLPRLGKGQRLAHPVRRPHAHAQTKASRPQPHTRLPTAPPGAARPACCPHLRARGCASCFRARLRYSLMAFSLSRARAYTFRAVFRSSSLMPSSGPCMPPTQSGCFCQVRSGPKLAPLVNSRA